MYESYCDECYKFRFHIFFCWNNRPTKIRLFTTNLFCSLHAHHSVFILNTGFFWFPWLLFLHSPSSPFHLGLSFKHYLVALSTRWGNHLLRSGTQDYPAIASTAQGQSRRDTHHSTFDWLPPKEPTNLHIQCIENITFWIHTWVITEAELSMVLILWFCHVLKQLLIITLQ